ncbi:MAG: ribonuclease III [Candidatus Paracaedibacteraceae bacterium]|nr:ribonuclease III [Candidatus Paracaedibacteraceae bacterium]
MTTPDLTPFEAVINYTFNDKKLMQKALAHPSAKPGNKEFERFEFLGDRVLGLSMAAILLELFRDEPEGHLAKRQAVLVSKESCQTVAQLLGLESYVLAICDQGVLQSNLMAILADAVEALLGAMYLDGGFEPCYAFVKHFWKDLFQTSKEPPKDAKSTLQEWMQKRGYAPPIYAAIGVTGPAHDPIFECEVQLIKLPSFKGKGRNRRMAEQDAAKAAVDYIKGRGK